MSTVSISGSFLSWSDFHFEIFSTTPFGVNSLHNPEKAVEILAQWKSEHEKKEPEIETVDICRIIEIQPDGRKRCVHEEYMGNIPIEEGKVRPSDRNIQKRCREILKRYCMEHEGEFIAVHEVVSRVKAVE